MTVHFIGAGPGAADLLTLRARALIAQSPVCLYAGSLLPPEILTHCPPNALLIDTADLTLDQILTHLEAAHRANQDVARLHSGDLSLWSTLAEQTRRLRALGIPYDVTPGVPSFAAAAAALAQELTLPTVAQTLILTRTSTRSTSMPPGESLVSLAQTGATLAIHLSIQNLQQITSDLTPSYGPTCPVAVVFRASWPDQLILRTTLEHLITQVESAGIDRQALIFVGPALAETADHGESFLYSPARDRSE